MWGSSHPTLTKQEQRGFGEAETLLQPQSIHIEMAIDGLISYLFMPGDFTILSRYSSSTSTVTSTYRQI